MQIIISVMVVGLLWMVYDLICAPELDDDENEISATPDLHEEPKKTVSEPRGLERRTIAKEISHSEVKKY